MFFAVSTTLLQLLLLCGATIQEAVVDTAGAASDSAECSLTNDGTCANKGAAADSTEERITDPSQLECGLWMAPSTLGEDTNMGMYAGKAYKNQDVINWPEIAIPLLFREWGEHREGFADGELWDRYIWEGSVANLEPYDDTNREDSRAVFVPGIGCTINSIMDMNNIDSTSGSLYDTAGLHRSKDPGAGAFTPYHSSNTTAVTDIPPGAEIFASYGDYWIPQIPGAQITLEDELEAAEDWLRQKYYPWIVEHDDQLDDEMKQSLWELASKEFPVYSKVFTNLPRNVPWKRVEEALKFHKAPVVSVVKKFIREQSVREDGWLRDRGYCQDHIRMGRSQIEQAGRGAFATRFLPKGTVVGYSPLIHMGVHGYELYNIHYDNKRNGMIGGHVTGQSPKRNQFDLILNYSFGHKNSSVVLTPYGGMVNYINHASLRKPHLSNGMEPNVKLRWPDRDLVAHKRDWLHRSPEVLKDTLEKIGLSFEYVALRDIEQGEEVLMGTFLFRCV